MSLAEKAKAGQAHKATSTLELGSLGDMVGVELRNTQLAAEKTFARISGNQMLAGHFTILMLINNNPGQNQTALARAAKLDRSTMVPVLDQFEAQGWVKRRACVGDRRAYALHLTPSGKQLLKKLEKKVAQMETLITSALGAEARTVLLQQLRLLQEIFQPQSED